MTTSASRFRVYLRDRPTVDAGDLPLIGEIDTYRSFQSTLRHNDIGSWQLKMTAGSPGTSLIQPGRGVVVFHDEEPNWPVFSGPISQIDAAWSQDDGHSLTVTGPCDNALFRERIARIDPTRYTQFEAEADANDVVPTEWDPTVIDFIDNDHYSVRAPNNTGEWIWSLVVLNYTNYFFGGDSDDSRAVRYLKLAPQIPPELKALPNDTVWQGFPINMTDLSTVVFQAAEAAGLSVRISWQPQTRSSLVNTYVDSMGLYLNIARVNDLSDSIVFGPDQGNLSSYTLSSVAPEATRMFIEAETTDNDRRWLGYRKNDLFDPEGWISWETRNANGEHYLAADWSDPNNGRHAIERDWNVTAEKFTDARDISWPYQPDPQQFEAAEDPHPGTAVDDQINQTALQFMVENGPKGLFSMTALDAPGCRYGLDYNVSDVVRILVDTSFIPESMRAEDGVIRDLVREVTISSSADSIWTIQPTVGTTDSSPTPYIYRQLKKLKAKIEDTTNRVEGDQTGSIKPYRPSLFIVNSEQGWTPESGKPSDTRPPSNHNFVATNRPLPWTSSNDSYVQLYVDSGGLIGDPRTPIMGQTEVTFEFRSSEDGDWKPAPQDQVYYDYTAKTTDDDYAAVWYHNSNLAGGVNSVRYWRARLSNNGTYSAWSNVVKLTAAAGSLNANGTLTLTAPNPSTRHQYAEFNITGTDTTYGTLKLYANDGSGWFDTGYDPTYVDNTYSFPYVATEAGTIQLRVTSFDEQGGFIENTGTVIKSSNTVTLTVVSP